MTREQKAMLFKVIGAIIALIGTFTAGNHYTEGSEVFQTCLYMLQGMQDDTLGNIQDHEAKDEGAI